MKTYNIIGIMSGTSLDGVDICLCSYTKDDHGDWSYRFKYGKTYPYPKGISQQLQDPFSLSANTMALLNVELGKDYGNCVNTFLNEFNIDKATIDAIASHGQTIFHQPEKGMTKQIGSGTKLAIETGIKVINNFRIKDIYLGGQGAPLVPIGDMKLFDKEADAFLNIGGFCNISYKKDKEVVAFDICPGNLPLNNLALKAGKKYDKDGKMARSGEINFYLLGLLNELEYYRDNPPKSLGIEWLEMNFYPLIKFDKDIANNLRTVVEHIAIQLSECINQSPVKKVMVTGGGAKNIFLMDRIKSYTNKEIFLPQKQIIDFKEAIIFGFLGALYLEKEVNVLKSVTGATSDSISGVLHLP